MKTLYEVVNARGKSDKIALFVANQAMRKLGWSTEPEIALEKMVRKDHLKRDLMRHYAARYTRYSDRESYVIEIYLMRTDERTDWANGYVVARHWSQIYVGPFTVLNSDDAPRVEVLTLGSLNAAVEAILSDLKPFVIGQREQVSQTGWQPLSEGEEWASWATATEIYPPKDLEVDIVTRGVFWTVQYVPDKLGQPGHDQYCSSIPLERSIVQEIFNRHLNPLGLSYGQIL